MFWKILLLIITSFPRKTSFEMTLTTKNSDVTVWKLLSLSLKVNGIIAMVAVSCNNWSFAPVLICKGFLLCI